MKTFKHKRETWSQAECEKRAKYAPANAFGDAPPRGIIAPSGSAYLQYGQTLRYNGGTIINGEWYEAESKPLPKIHKDFEFANLCSWGTIIRKKTKKGC